MKSYYQKIVLKSLVFSMAAYVVPAYADVVTSGEWQYDGNTISIL